MKIILYTLISFSIFSASCQNQQNTPSSAQKEMNKLKNSEPIQTKTTNGLEKAYFASGCFWCVEAIYESVKGVKEVISGYSGGYTENPTYESSNTGRTGHAEAVEVIYDPKVVSFETLVDVYFGSQNPTQLNGQGPDHGSQYRSIIFYQNKQQKNSIDRKKKLLSKSLNNNIAAEILPFQKFWVAEQYHQNYEKLHPNQGYIRNVSIPRLNRFKVKFPHLIKEKSH